MIAVLIAFFTAQWWFVSAAILDVAESQMRSRLAHDAETIASALTWKNGQPELPPEKTNTEYRRAYSGHYYRVTVGANEIRSRSLWDFQPADKSCSSRRSPGPMGQILIVHCLEIRKNGNEVSIWTAEETTDLDSSVSIFQKRYTIITLVAISAILIAQILAVYAGFAPLRSAVVALRKHGSASLDRTLPSEIQPFMEEIKRLVSTLQSRVDISRKTAANLVHEQKTQLAAIHSSLSSIRDKQPAPDVLVDVSEVAARAANLKDIAERHMTRSAIAGAISAGTPFDWKKDLDDLTKTMLRVYADKGPRIEVKHNQSPQWTMERQDAIELFGILLDNACRFCTGQVVIGLDTSEVTIEDDGPGCTEEQMKQLSLRGARIDEFTEGGLGLSIARELAESYQMTLSFSRSPSGGLRVSIRNS